VRQFLWLALILAMADLRHGGPSLWRPFAMADPNLPAYITRRYFVYNLPISDFEVKSETVNTQLN